MTKADIVKEIASETGIEKTTVTAVVEALMEAVKGSVVKQEPVYLRGFGTFGIKHRAAKVARNIKARTTIVVEEHDVPCFKPCRDFKIR